MSPKALTSDGPLSLQVFHILISLHDSELHGYGIIQQVSARTEGALRLSASTLYGAIKRMLRDRLIEESEERPAPDQDDERRRYYRITQAGREAVTKEGQRVTELARMVAEQGLLPEHQG
jgi:DNA-binding PadR family transcriptional regulator